MINTHLLVLSFLLTGALANPPTPVDGFCASYVIQGYDTCALIAQAHGITEADIEAFNTRTWAWLGCNQLYQGDFICLSAGEPPMPMALPNAVCGPQIPGTMRPSNWAELGSMHPCPLNQCCATWGQCGTGAEFCDTKARKPPAGVTATVSAATEAAQATTLATQPDEAVVAVQPESEPKSQKTSEAAQPESEPKAQTKQSEPKEKPQTTSTTSKPTTTSDDGYFKNTDKPWEGNLEIDGWKEPWEVIWYSEKNCEGDYYTLSGYNDETPSGKRERCLNRKEGLNSELTETNVTCRWWTEGGLKWAPCEAGTLDKPQSWVLRNAYCTIYDAYNCDCFDHYAQSYGSEGCRNRDKFDPPKFVSFGCVHIPYD
ncbi:unnamed protein product [Penicillium olsonii]|nr:unnamed protein product [Penicillium olsonii]